MTIPRRGGVLMICYHYLPANNGGVERSVKFARYLPAHGWEPIIVTTNRFGAGGGAWGERVVRTWQPRGKLFSRAVLRRVGDAEWIDIEGSGADRRGRFHRSALDFVDRWLMIPDNKIHWAACAVPAASGILKRGEADVIYTSSPPNSSHILGLLLKKLTDRPWIMDMRDPWTFEPLIKWLQDGVRLSIERRLERWCFDLADIVVANTDAAAARYRLMYPRHSDKVRVITNGFDGDEMENAAATAAEGPLRGIGNDVFVMSNLGTFSGFAHENDCPGALLLAIRHLLDRGIVTDGTFRVVFAGHVAEETRRRIAGLGLEGVTCLPGMVPHTDALRIMTRSNLLLLIDTRSHAEYSIHGKLYEYLAARRWILAMVPPGPNRDLLARSGHGLFVSSVDADGIAAAVIEAMKREGRPETDPGFDIARFERGRLAARLVECLDEVWEGKGGG
jgi:glycosyltransferase involved in cell wall biosynthesis